MRSCAKDAVSISGWLFVTKCGTLSQIGGQKSSRMCEIEKNSTRPLTGGFQKGKAEEPLFVVCFLPLFPLAVGRVRETYGTFPGGALHTFSPRRKYEVPPPAGGNPHFSRRLPRQCAHWLAMTRLYKNHPGGNSGVVSPF